MKHQEADSSLILRHYLRANPYHTCAIEMKDSRGKDYISFSEVKQAQIDFGMAIKSKKGVLMRTPAVVEGMPDYIYMNNEPAVICIKWPKELHIIDIETFVLERDRSKRKSLTKQRSGDIAIKVIVI